MRELLFFLTILTLIGACADASDRLEKTVEKGSIGSSSDYWLEVSNLYGEWEKLALVHGYFDDYEGCTDIAELLAENYDRLYRCTIAN